MLISRENMPVKSNPVNKNVGHHLHATNMETVNLLSLKKSSRHKIVWVTPSTNDKGSA